MPDPAQEKHPFEAAGLRFIGKVAEEAWGSLWRAEHAEFGAVIAVCYQGSKGRALFEECLPHLRQWEKIAGSAAKCLLRIRALVEGKAPYLLVENPGGMFLHEKLVAAGPFGLEDGARCFRSVAQGLVYTNIFEIPHAGLAPYTLLEDPASPKEEPWKLLPVGPGALKNAKLIARGRYMAPELANHGTPADLRADSYAAAWLWAEAATGNLALKHNLEALSTALPHVRLRTILRGGFEPHRGVYMEPKLLQVAADRYLKTEAAEDRKDEEEARAAATRSPAQRWIAEHQPQLILGSKVLGVVVALLLVVWLVPAMFTTTNTPRTPYGMVNLYLEALVARNLPAAQRFATGEAVGQTAAMLADIERMEKANLASRFSRGLPQVSGSGEARTVKVDMRGKNGDIFMAAEMTIRQASTGNWSVETLFFKAMREPDPPASAPTLPPPSE